MSHILRPEELRHPVVITPSSVAQVAARRVGHRRVLKAGSWHERTGEVCAAPLPSDVTALGPDGEPLTLAEGQSLYITLHTMDPTHAIYLVSR